MDIYILFTNNEILKENILEKLKEMFKETKKILIFPVDITDASQTTNWIKENIETLTGRISSFQFRTYLLVEDNSEFLMKNINLIKENIKKKYPETLIWSEVIKIFLEELQTTNNAFVDESNFDFTWLISQWNGYVKISSKEICNMINLFYYLEILTEKHTAYTLREFSKRGSFGMVILDLPFQFLKEKTAEGIAQKMLAKILETPPNSLKTEGEKFWQSEIIDFDNLKMKIKNDVKLDFKDKKIDLRKGEESKWANILSSVYNFFLIKGAEPYRQMIKRYYQEISQKIINTFRTKIDTLLEWNINPSSIFSFLFEVYRKTIMEKRRQHEFSISSSKVQQMINAIKEKYKTLPFFSSVLLRIITFSFVIAFTLYLLLPKIIEIESSPILFIFLYFSALIFFFFLFFFPFKEKRQDFINTVIETENMIWQTFDEYLDYEAHMGALRIFSKLESASGSPEDLEKDPPLFDKEESEYLAIKDYLQKIRSASESSIIKTYSPFFPFLNLLEYNTPKVEYEGEIDNDLEDCVKNGLHKNWRQNSPEEILQKCINFLVKRIKITPDTISEFLKNLKEELQNKLKNQILEWSMPYFLNNSFTGRSFFIFTNEELPKNLFPENAELNINKIIENPIFLTICYEPQKDN